MTLRSKLIGVFLIPMLLIVTGFGFLLYGLIRQELEDELGRRLVSIGQTTSVHFSQSVDAKQISRIDSSKKRVIARFQKRFLDLKNATHIQRAMLFRTDGTAIADTDKTPFNEQIYVLNAHQSEVEKAFQGTPTTSILFATKGGSFDKIGFVPVRDGDNVVAVIGIVGSAEYFEILNDLAKMLAILSFGAMMFIILVATYFSKRMTGPINELVIATRRFGKGDFQTKLDMETRDEIGQLGSAFEDMRKDILRRDEQMQMMLSGIAHEVRNPLGGMSLFLGLLKEDLEQEKEAHSENLEQVKKIRRELKYLEDVVSDFLNFAKNAPLHVERFKARPFIEEIVELLRGEAEKKNAYLKANILTELELVADREKIKSALINVVRNAYQACNASCDIEIDILVEENTRIIRITDNGPGIPQHVLSHIFEPFFTTKEKGSGLGLALTQRIVQQHRGDLDITTEVGVGTVLRFRLPFDSSVESTETIPEGWLG